MKHPVHPPLASPVVPRDVSGDHGKEPITGSHFIAATMADVKAAKLNAEALAETKTAEAKETLTKYVVASDVKWFVSTMAAVAVGAVLLVGWLDARSQTKVDGGTAPLAARIDKGEARLDRVEGAVQDVKLTVAEIKTMTTMLLRDRGLPVPPPTPRPDGGR